MHLIAYTVVNTRLLMACRARSMLPLVASTAATVEPCIKSSRSNSGVRGLHCEHSPGGRGGPIQRENFLGTTSCRTCLLQKCATSVDIPATLDHGTLCQTIDAYASVRAGRQSFIEFSGKQRRPHPLAGRLDTVCFCWAGHACSTQARS